MFIKTHFGIAFLHKNYIYIKRQQIYFISSHSTGITIKKYFYIKEQQLRLLGVIKVTKKWIKTSKYLIKFKQEHCEKLFDIQWALKLLIPDLKIRIHDWSKFGGFGWTCNYLPDECVRLTFSNIKIKVVKNNIEFTYNKKDFELLFWYINNIMIESFLWNRGALVIIINNKRYKWNGITTATKLYKTNYCRIEVRKGARQRLPKGIIGEEISLLWYIVSFTYDNKKYLKYDDYPSDNEQ